MKEGGYFGGLECQCSGWVWLIHIHISGLVSGHDSSVYILDFVVYFNRVVY